MPLILLNKPFHVLSQFRDPDGRRTLAEFIRDKSVYPAGRLDYDSEGLILLTDDGKLQARISEARQRVLKHYWAQVEGTADQSLITKLLSGVTLKDGPAKARDAAVIKQPEPLWPRDPPIRKRKNKPTSWIRISIDEGRNRQVRRMTAAAGSATLRLIRYQVGPWTIENLDPGESQRLSNREARMAIQSLL